MELHVPDQAKPHGNTEATDAFRNAQLFDSTRLSVRFFALILHASDPKRARSMSEAGEDLA
jgi:hypothetical protein